MKKSNSNVLEFTTKFINSNFRIKVFGRTEDGKKINTLVGVSGILSSSERNFSTSSSSEH